MKTTTYIGKLLGTQSVIKLLSFFRKMKEIYPLLKSNENKKGEKRQLLFLLTVTPLFWSMTFI